MLNAAVLSLFTSELHQESAVKSRLLLKIQRVVATDQIDFMVQDSHKCSYSNFHRFQL